MSVITKGDKVYFTSMQRVSGERVGHDMTGATVSEVDGFGLVSVRLDGRSGGPSLYAREQLVATTDRNGDTWHVLYL